MNIIEWIAALVTLSSVLMLAKGKSSGWILGIIGSILYGILFLEQKLYANFILQIFFIAQNFYGIYSWHQDIKNDTPFSVKKLDYVLFLTLLFGTLALSAILFMGFYSYDNMFLDISITLFSILAMFMMAKKYIQAWFIWMAIDIGYICLFLSSNMFISTILYCCLFLICINGYIKWKKCKIN